MWIGGREQPESDNADQSDRLCRLLLQHQMFKSAFNNRLLLAPHNKEASYNILDSATGSGE